MAISVGLTDAKIKGLRPPETGQEEHADKNVPGLRVRIGKRGAPTFILRKRIAGKACNVSLGRFHEKTFTLAAARAKARDIISGIEAGEDPRPAPATAAEEKDRHTFKAISEAFLERHVDRNNLRSAKETRRIFESYVWPEWGSQLFLDIRRRAVTELLDKVEDRKAGESGSMGGPVQADRVLAALSKFFAWHASRDDDYVSPIVRGMRRTKPRERARKRVLGLTVDGEANDAELRLFWTAAGEAGAYGAFLKLCLLTAQRRAKVMHMQRAAIVDGTWSIEAEAREKANAAVLDLPPMAAAIIEEMPEIAENPYVLAGAGKAALWPGDKLKKDFDAKLAKANGGQEIPHWTIHDLRRTAKTLMRRAGVDSEISERVLGHVIAGVEGVYDRHGYRQEKADALLRLEGLLKLILKPTGKVVQIKRAK